MKVPARRFRTILAIAFAVGISVWLSADASSVLAASGQVNYTPIEDVPGFENGAQDFPTYLRNIFVALIWIAGISAMFMIGVGGFWYITSAGNSARVSKSKNIIGEAVIGLSIALAAWLLLYTIDPNLTKLHFASLDWSGTGAANGTPSSGASPNTNTQTAAGQLGDKVTVSSGGDCKKADGTVVSPALNVQETKDGRPITVCKDGCKTDPTKVCDGTATLSPKMLPAITAVAQSTGTSLRIESIGGGDHKSTSIHYQGRAVDIIPSSSKDQWESIKQEFRKNGAVQAECDGGGVFYPCTDSRVNHIHVVFP